MGRVVKIPWVGGLIYHGLCGRYTMGRGRYTIGKGVDISWVEGSIYHG